MVVAMLTTTLDNGDNNIDDNGNKNYGDNDYYGVNDDVDNHNFYFLI